MRELPTGAVTFLFSDIEGSTKLLEKLGSKQYSEALAEHRRRMRAAFAAHGGVEVDTQGDAFFVAFPEARAALAAADEAPRELAQGPVRVRMGIHTGKPLATPEGYVGMDVHRGARVMSAGHGGQVLVSEETYTQVDGDTGLTDLGLHRLKDLTEPQRLWQLGEHKFPPLKTLYQTNLPLQPTPLVGRESELAQVLGLIQDSRLVTFTGPGGSGKTRLALQAAAELVDEYKDGVWWVSLAALRDPELVEPTIAQVIGAKDGLAEHLRGRQTLLLLDNFEQLLEAAPRLSALLAEAPGLRLLATSRERLALSAEQEYAVPTMVPVEAVALFTARARQLEPDFEPDDAVEEICRRLDGLPLAVELAAARIKVLTPEQLLERLGRSLELLTAGARDAPERHQTLRATIEWSYQLLVDDERRLFARLGVFAGSFDLEAAEAICGAGLDTLQSLLDKSLLRGTDDGRFFMLETIHEYALEKLNDRPELETLLDAHARYFADFVGRANGKLDPVLNDVRAALDRLRSSGEDDLFARASVDLVPFWRLRGHLREARARLEAAIDAAHDDELRCRALIEFADMELRIDEGRPLEHANRAVDTAQALGDKNLELWALGVAANALARADPAAAAGAHERVADLAREASETLHEVRALINLGPLALAAGDVGRARTATKRALELSPQLDDPEVGAIAAFNHGLTYLEEQRFDEARGLFVTALAPGIDLDWPEGILYPLGALAVVAMGQGRPRQATRLLGAVSTLQEQTGLALWHVEREMYERTRTSAEDALGRSFAEEFEAGRRLSVDAAVAEALSLD